MTAFLLQNGGTSDLSWLKSPNHYFGYFDIVFWVLILLSIFALYKSKRRIHTGLIIGITLIIFGLVGPIASAIIETKIVHDLYDTVDAFNLLYLYFRFPVWWVIGIILSVLLLVIQKKKKGDTINNDDVLDG
jgi:lipoprotein signal peptidase